MKVLAAFAFLAVACAVPQPGLQSIQLPPPATPEVFEADVSAPTAVNVVDGPLDDAQDPASNFQYAPTDTVIIIEHVADYQHNFDMSMIDISPMFVSEDVMKAVQQVAAEAQSIQLPEPAMPETFEEAVDAVNVVNGDVSDASQLNFEPVNVVDGAVELADNAGSLSFEPVPVEDNNEQVFKGREFERKAVNSVDSQINEMSFEPVPVETNNEVVETPVEAVRVADAPELNAFDAVKVVDIAENNFQQIAPSELEATRIAEQSDDLPEDFLAQPDNLFTYSDPYLR